MRIIAWLFIFGNNGICILRKMCINTNQCTIFLTNIRATFLLWYWAMYTGHGSHFCGVVNWFWFMSSEKSHFRTVHLELRRGPEYNESMCFQSTTTTILYRESMLVTSTTRGACEENILSRNFRLNTKIIDFSWINWQNLEYS